MGLSSSSSDWRCWQLLASLGRCRPVPDLPEGDLSADDLRSAHFAVVPRGYSMRQVDQLLDRMAAQLEAAPKEGFADTAEHAPNGKGLDTE